MRIVLAATGEWTGQGQRPRMNGAAWLKLLDAICNEADRIALAYYRGSNLAVRSKSDGSLVTRADVEIETVAREMTARLEPGLGTLGEEFGESGSAKARLIIDPIDATYNFVRGIPIFATLAAVEADGEVLGGMVSAPALATRWSAVRDAGARRNQQRIRVSSVDRIEQAQLFHAGFDSMGQSGYLDAVMRLARRTRRQRGFGDFYQDVLIAEGAGEIALDFGIAPWDIAALKIIVEEAGGTATSAGGKTSIYEGSWISTNGLLHGAVIEALAARR
jgi:histidinol-phosphatase